MNCFFENLVVSQANEVVHISKNTAQDCFKTIHDFYGIDKSIGYISNRINKYSIEVLDYPKDSSLFPNLEIYAVIGYSHFSEMNIEI